jgi:hypothetical protein
VHLIPADFPAVSLSIKKKSGSAYVTYIICDFMTTDFLSHLTFSTQSLGWVNLNKTKIDTNHH